MPSDFDPDKPNTNPPGFEKNREFKMMQNLWNSLSDAWVRCLKRLKKWGREIGSALNDIEQGHRDN